VKAFFKRLFCRHREGRVIAIAWDGETTIECSHCGKIIRRPLS
jgi:uncharacterized C2H2 Zn-finger protein